MKRSIAWILLLVMVLGLVGCGSTTTTTTTTNTSTAPAEPEKTEAAEEAVDYKIAAYLPFTGNYKSYADYIKAGLDLGVEVLEKNGGLNGKGGKITIDYYDDANSPEEAIALAEKIVENDEYLLSVGSFSSGVTLPCASVYNEAEMVQFAPTCSHRDFLSMTDWGFSLSMSTDMSNAYLATWSVKSLGAQNIAIIYENSEVGSVAKEAYRKVAEQLGATIVAEEGYVAGTTNDFSSIITKFKQHDIDLVYLTGSDEELIYTVKAAQQLDFNPEYWMCPTKCATQNTIDSLGADFLERKVYAYQGKIGDESNPVYVQYRDAYFEKYPNENATSQWVDYGYNAMLMIIWAIENGGTDRESVRDVLATVRNFQCVDGLYTFGEGHVLMREYCLATVIDGKWTLVPVDYDMVEVLESLS